MSSTAVDQLIALADEPDPYGQDPVQVRVLQFQGAQERLDERRAQIRVLDQRVRDVGVDTIKSWDDLVPLLFSHTTYKSYLDSFITNGRWDRLLQWYATFAATPVGDVDLSGVTGIDGWVEALWSAGHRAYASSGQDG